MKVTVTDRKVKEVERVYPYYGIHKDGSIVIFTGCEKGFCIIDTEDKSNTNIYSETWGEEKFTPLVNKTITIEV